MIRILSQIESTRILTSNYIGNLGYIYRNRPYVVPITYFFDAENNVIIGYSAEGHKIRAMRKNENVSLSVSEVDSVNSWNSVMAQGRFSELSGSDAKAQLHIFSLGVKDLIINKEHRKLDFISDFSSKIYKDDLPIVFQIKIDEITGRIRRN
ncbi:pyridoxamine 5'-phosphate oxidase family protein [Winogradskyella bathintestinalis]|uniref:Pyridoxamine 5'-phosphate oxidase family protein n=1 Tax=Winogradskyella bathintestinalis TaxID=3035208 RepID=A0ABT7ZW32_9FLAO|nr:pyridoxamine 5'-phosphate oxidase family protein [Winogradskyella bathintestinalis]MDN3493231.1 pyridoxamine 5'-phosphate oxidase family protein [Winogradskyella bathintestinalis]